MSGLWRWLADRGTEVVFFRIGGDETAVFLNDIAYGAGILIDIVTDGRCATTEYCQAGKDK